MSLFDRFKKAGSRPAANSTSAGPTPVGGSAPATRAEPAAYDLTEVRHTADTVFCNGFHTFDEALAGLFDYYEGCSEPETGSLEADFEAVLRQAWQDRLAEQATWDGPGDYAKLADAFERLQAGGIVARMNFTCCQTCGHAEIGDEASRGPDQRILERGYVFFHQQDSARIADGGELYLAFGAFTADQGTDPQLLDEARQGNDQARSKVLSQASARESLIAHETAIAHDVAAALRASGLDVEWDGDISQRIRVHITQWRMPLPAG
ncbi:MAG: hypothetical protein LBK54_06340 [Propionibacteriaceae bacterium]|jgi:hypothetical protein|nr:hypothetical protein [Propionibacteriaceae bacterium]